MTMPVEPTKSGNVYFNDPESGAEMARLLDQDHLITKGMGGLFPERETTFLASSGFLMPPVGLEGGRWR